MKFSTSVRMKELAATAAGVLIVFVGYGVVRGEEVVSPVEERALQEAVYLTTGVLPLRVSGVVEAADSTIVYAETAGVVRELRVYEGAAVSVGQVLAVQSTPVADARFQLAAAERELGQLNQSLNTELRAGQAAQAGYQARSAAEIATLRAAGNDSRVAEVSTALQTTIEQGVLELTAAIDYVNNNRHLFSTKGLRLYDAVVTDLYGSVPSYFRGGIATVGASGVDLQSLVAELDGSNPAELELTASLLGEQLAAVTNLYATAESDVFDRQAVYVTDEMQAAYLSKRSGALSAAQSLSSAQAAFSQMLDGVLEDAVGQDTAVAVSALDEELAATQASYAAAIATQSDAVAAAGEAVVAAELSLGRPTAPFSGVVSEVLVDKGQYVTAGMPLLTLVGNGARELEVSVPSYLLPYVAVGQSFVVDDTVVGHVDRFSAVANGGSGVVVIALDQTAVLQVGSSLSGDIAIAADGAVRTVPRSYMHFDTDGAFVQYETGATARAEIVYDAGDVLYVELDRVSETPLVPAVSIAL